MIYAELAQEAFVAGTLIFIFVGFIISLILK